MELIKLLPEYYDENVTMQTLQSILSKETDDLETGLSDTISECFASTASVLLSRYENLLGLTIDVTKENDYRRERICAKLAGTGTTTKEMIDNANSRFVIRFVGTLGIPGNMADLKLTIEEIKPAHLAVEYEYIYNTWSDISALTWQQATSYTWEKIRTVRL